MQPHPNTIIILSVDARFQEEVLQRNRAKQAVQHYYLPNHRQDVQHYQRSQDSRFQKTWLQDSSLPLGSKRLMQSTRLRCTDRCRCKTLLSIYSLISQARSACISGCICEQQCIFHNAPTKCQCSSKHEQYSKRAKYVSAHQYITAHTPTGAGRTALF